MSLPEQSCAPGVPAPHSSALQVSKDSDMIHTGHSLWAVSLLSPAPASTLSTGSRLGQHHSEGYSGAVWH